MATSVIGAATLSLGGCGNEQPVQHATAVNESSSSVKSSKPNITQMSESLVVGQDSFPTVDDGEWLAPKISTSPSYKYVHADPKECWALVGGYGGVPHGPNSVAWAGVRKNGGADIDFTVELILPNADLPEWSSILDRCHAVSEPHEHWAFQPISAENVPSWAVRTMKVNDDPNSHYYNWKAFQIFGNYHGLVVEVSMHRLPEPTADDIAAATRVFNCQPGSCALGTTGWRPGPTAYVLGRTGPGIQPVHSHAANPAPRPTNGP